jgi:UDP-N-acetylglucosamine 1-carboxyvinyltransferase
MDKIKISGGRRLQGKIAIGGAKNAALPLMAAALLTDETLTLSNLPHLDDITSMTKLLSQHGVALHLNGNAPNGGHTGRVLDMQAAEIASTTAPYDLVRKMRASVLVLGPLVARCGIARVSLPGGCAIGNRPVDLHLKALEVMGAEIHLTEGYIEARAPGGLKGGHILFPQVSVGATENAIMAASLADGVTTIANAAREPEVADLAHCLVAMGAEIEGIGTDTLKVTGKPRLHGAEYSVVPDRIETGTYAIAAAITGGEIELVGTRIALINSLESCHPSRCRCDDRTLSRLSDRHAGPVHGIDVGCQWRVDDYGNHF